VGQQGWGELSFFIQSCQGRTHQLRYRKRPANEVKQGENKRVVWASANCYLGGWAYKEKESNFVRRWKKAADTWGAKERTKQKKTCVFSGGQLQVATGPFKGLEAELNLRRECFFGGRKKVSFRWVQFEGSWENFFFKWLLNVLYGSTINCFEMVFCFEIIHTIFFFYILNA
jgi:hypothetical protein